MTAAGSDGQQPCTCVPFPQGTGPEEDCPVHGVTGPDGQQEREDWTDPQVWTRRQWERYRAQVVAELRETLTRVERVQNPTANGRYAAAAGQILRAVQQGNVNLPLDQLVLAAADADLACERAS